MNQKRKYRFTKIEFVESPSVRHTIGILIQEDELENNGKCLCKFREDRKFLDKILSVRFENQPPEVDYSYGDILLPAQERFNDHLAVDLRVEIVSQELKASGRSDEDSIIVTTIKPGDPAILNEIRKRQPRIDPNDPESPIMNPHFEFTDWDSVTSKDPTIIVLSELIKEIEDGNE